MKNFKKWSIGFFALILLVFVFIVGMNYFVDPMGYFAYRGGDYNKLGDIPVSDTNYARFFKAEHVKNFGDQYEGYIIGGSKAGTYHTEGLKEIDGYNYYNMFATAGNMDEYYQVAKYIVENTNVKKIILNISGGEVRRLSSEHLGDIFKIPAAIRGESEALEYIDFMLKDVTVSIEQVSKELKNKNKEVKVYPNAVDGSRNLIKYYENKKKDPSAFTSKYVTKDLDKKIKKLFTKPTNRDTYQTILETIRNIKSLCDDNEVELLVIMAPAFIAEMSEHDGPAYWQYMYDVFSITDVWDFSGYHDIDLNPYNFYNSDHFFFEVFDLMVDTMNGTRSYDGFGTFVTKENAYEHIEQRKADYYRLKKEYEETGTVKLDGYDDASRIK